MLQKIQFPLYYFVNLFFFFTCTAAKKNSTRNVVKINTYSATAAATAEPQETPATGGSNNSSRLTTENMNRMSEQLAAIGGQASASIVGVKNKTDAQDFYQLVYICKMKSCRRLI